jgi:hypothetical protein
MTCFEFEKLIPQAVLSSMSTGERSILTEGFKDFAQTF